MSTLLTIDLLLTLLLCVTVTTLIVPFNIFYRYDSTTGTFTVPPGGDGFYYFSTYLLGTSTEYNVFDIQINGNKLCTVHLDQQQTSGDALQSSCSAAIYAAEGISQ